ncbi:hypothetical protein [Litchfieldia salsa]|uniref:Uncharacterized protein n=1 Tax=Litchfieldia salsa TaxID=930152 RepID=A0A1H0TYL1_9BACI|nr:hypothetical protein [Litchfieldia salsa]SDP59137.1 hypothetical protein SAMN05216565_10434 [Litchfieldia salsa]
MSIIMLILCSIILLLISGYAFYTAFKKYEEDDDFTGGMTTLTIIELVLSFLLFLAEKLTPKKYHILIFKIEAFLFGMFILGLTVLLWILFI